MNQDYTIRKMTADDFRPLWNIHRDTIFSEDHSYRFWDLMDEKELEKTNELRKHVSNKIEIRLGLFDSKDKFIGWCWGFQENATTFYMCNSAILPEYRRKGLYTRLLNQMVEELTELGFQLIFSRHCATNNDVIIPKLKAGFLISKMELDDVFGVLIHLHYYPNKKRRKIMDYRSGQLAPDDEIKEIFNFGDK
jgi:ribosomal protein S18 acetylase RimI-like enzyme